MKDKKCTLHPPLSLRACPAALSLHFVSLGAYNKGYTVQPSARASPKFFFHFVPEKLLLSRNVIYNCRQGWL